MQVFRSNVTLGIFVSVIVAFQTNLARADDPTGGGYFQLETSDGYCLGLEHDSLNNGTQMEEATCHPTSAAQTQAWWWDTDDCISVRDPIYPYHVTKYCTIRTSNNKCLGVYGGSTNRGAYAAIWDCLGTSHPDQYWSTVAAPYGWWRIWNYQAKSYGLGYAGTTSESCGFSFTCYHYQVGLEPNVFVMLATPASP